jgi:type IV pilus assembly protein PilB
MKYIPFEVARRYHLVPLALAGGNLRIAIADPSNHFAIEDIKFMTGMNISVYVGMESLIMEAIEKYYPATEKGAVPAEPADGVKQDTISMDEVDRTLDTSLQELSVTDLPPAPEQKDLDVPVEKMLRGVIMNAVKYHASDIHIEPTDEILRVRYRIDGVLKPVLKLPVAMKNVMNAKVKILFRLDIAEKRMPQSGRVKFRFGADRDIDCRASTFPTLFGEKIVIKILDKSHLAFDLHKLGFDERQLSDFLDAARRPSGLVLVSGPAESGKTSTIYSTLLHVNRPGINIITAEDPVEFNLYGVNQGQIKPEIGLTYAAALEAFLTQDPDIIMVGELKDLPTAELAVKAALTGHLVLSTIPANDAAGAVSRLIHMGIEPFAVASAISLSVAQRLVRKVCEICKTEQPFTEDALLKMGFPPESVASATCYAGAGCASCNNTGYSGRTAIYEIMPMRREIRELILKNASASDLKHEAILLGMSTLRQSGIRKVLDGNTSVDEVLRVTFED